MEGEKPVINEELLDLLSTKVLESTPTATEDALGFTRIVKLMSSLKKPLICHNGLMDLMFLYEKFYNPLPESLADFKAHLNSLYPHIYDTKHMFNVRQELQ